MKKITLSLLLCSALFSGELRFGHGTMKFTGGFLGFTQSVSEGIDTFTFEQNHKNILGSKTFYAYNLTWYDSQHFKQMQSMYNTGVSQSFNWLLGGATPTTFVPTMDYRLQGLDASLSLGYDMYNLDENNYFGVGGYLGINLPWVDVKKDSHYLDNLPSGVDSSKLYKYYKDSKTDIKTYKLGIALYGRKSLVPSLSFYSNFILAYQTGSISNDYANSSMDVDGSYTSLDLGVRFQPYEQDFKLWKVTFSPRLYITAGYKMERWSVDDVAIDISGMNMKMPKTTMKFDTDTAYLGFGYSF